MLLGSDVMIPNSIIIDGDQRTLKIQACARLTTDMNVERRAKPQTKVRPIRVARNTTLAPRTTIGVSIETTDGQPLPKGHNYLFEPNVAGENKAGGG